MNFFIRRHCYEDGTITVWLGGEKDEVRVQFQFVRTTLHYKESEFYERMNGYKGPTIFDGGEPLIGIFRLRVGAMLLDLVPERLVEEKPNVYWVSTADECLEVLGFEDPVIDIL